MSKRSYRGLSKALGKLFEDEDDDEDEYVLDERRGRSQLQGQTATARRRFGPKNLSF
jgi:hypothetical protein